MKPTIQEQKPGIVSVDIVPSNEIKAVIIKPTVQEQNPGIVSVDIVPSNETKKESNKLITKFSIVVISLILVCGVVLAAVYFGKRLAGDNFKEYHGIVHRIDGPTTTETWRFTNTEEDLENDDIRAVYDFETGLAVFVLKGQTELTDCYVASFNLTEMETPADVRKTLTSTEFELTEKVIIVKTYEVTDVWLNPNTLRERSQMVCDGRHIFFLRSVEGEPSRVSKRLAFYSYQLGGKEYNWSLVGSSS